MRRRRSRRLGNPRIPNDGVPTAFCPAPAILFEAGTLSSPSVLKEEDLSVVGAQGADLDYNRHGASKYCQGGQWRRIRPRVVRRDLGSMLMKKSSPLARVFYLLAAIGFCIGGWREHGLLITIAGLAVAVILILLARRNARNRKKRAEGSGTSGPDAH